MSFLFLLLSWSVNLRIQRRNFIHIVLMAYYLEQNNKRVLISITLNQMNKPILLSFLLVLVLRVFS